MMNKAIVNEFIKNQDTTSLEKHFIYAYLNSKKLDFSKSIILTEYFNGFIKLPKLYFEILTLDISSIKELENYLELIIPNSDRKLNGAFFTPNYIVDFIFSFSQSFFK